MTTDVDLRPPGGAGAGCPSRNVVPVDAALPTCAVAATCNHRGEGGRRCTNPCRQGVVCRTETGVAAAVPASARRLSLAEHFRDANPQLARRRYRNLKTALLKPAGTSAIPLACARSLSLYVSRARVGVCGDVRILAWAPTHLAEGLPSYGQPTLKREAAFPGVLEEPGTITHATKREGITCRALVSAWPFSPYVSRARVGVCGGGVPGELAQGRGWKSPGTKA